MKYPALDLSTINKIVFPDDQYYKDVTMKKQICLHHTASGPGEAGDIKWWLMDPRRVATCVIIGRNGEIDQCFESKYWAHHLGTTQRNNSDLNKACIGIEIDAWGPVFFNEEDKTFRSYMGSKVPAGDVVNYGAQGFKKYPSSAYFDQVGATGKPATHYHCYSAEQIKSVAQLLELWGTGYGIPLTYNADMWALSPKALVGQPGVWTHVSYRTDKQDCHPQPEFVAMLKSLTA